MRDDWEVLCHPGSVEAFAFERDQPEIRAELDGFVAECRDGMVLFDIGAHFGLFTLAALHWGGPAARSVAVDPSIAALHVFDENMRLAGAGTRVQRHYAAIGAEDGELLLLTGGAGSLHMMTAPETPRHDTVPVPLWTLDSLVQRSGLSPTHVKIDVEGEEDGVLRGGETVLRRDRPIVFLELHCGILRRSGREPLAVLARLQSYGYRVLEIAGKPILPADAAALDVARIVCRS